MSSGSEDRHFLDRDRPLQQAELAQGRQRRLPACPRLGPERRRAKLACDVGHAELDVAGRQ